MRYDTWYEIKLKAFQKMFAINNGSTQIPTDMMGKDYENAMPGAANEALQMLATTGKFIIKSIDISHIPVKSLIQNSERIRSVERGTITYEAEGARSMYYECKGKGTMSVKIGDEIPVETEFDDTASLGYVPHKIQIPEPIANISDTEYDRDKEVNNVVAGDEVTLIIENIQNAEWVTLYSPWTESENGKFEVVSLGGKNYQITYTDRIDSPNLDIRWVCNCRYCVIEEGEEVVYSRYSGSHDLHSLPRVNDNIVVSFKSDYPLSLKNVGMYSAVYENEDDIPPYSEYVRYDLRELVDDYYMVDPEGIIYEGNREVSRYMATSDWFEEGYNILLLRRDKPGNYKIYYKAYPQPITLGTPDDTELVLDPEVSALLPLYIASQVYKDDDPSTATIYRNEFEVAYERLVKNVEAPSQEHFVSVSGWI